MRTHLGTTPDPLPRLAAWAGRAALPAPARRRRRDGLPRHQAGSPQGPAGRLEAAAAPRGRFETKRRAAAARGSTSEGALTDSERPPEGPGGSVSPGPQPLRRTRFLGAAAAPCRPRSIPAGPRSDSPRPPASQPTPGAGSEAKREEAGSAAPEASSRPGPARGLLVPQREEQGENDGGSGARRPPAHGRLRCPHTAPRPLCVPPVSIPLRSPPRLRSPPPAEGVDPQRLPTGTCRPNGRRAPAAHVRNPSSQPQPSAQPGRNPRRPRPPANPRPARSRAPPPSSPSAPPPSRPRPTPLIPPPLAEAPVNPQNGCSATAPLLLVSTAAARLGRGSVFVGRPGPVVGCLIACVILFVPTFSQHRKDELSFGQRSNAQACAWCTCVQERKTKLRET